MANSLVITHMSCSLFSLLHSSLFYFFIPLGNGERLKVSMCSLGRWGNEITRGSPNTEKGERMKRREAPTFSPFPSSPHAPLIFHFLCFSPPPSTERASVEGGACYLAFTQLSPWREKRDRSQSSLCFVFKFSR